jgi:hypothetical protein
MFVNVRFVRCIFGMIYLMQMCNNVLEGWLGGSLFFLRIVVIADTRSCVNFLFIRCRAPLENHSCVIV